MSIVSRKSSRSGGSGTIIRPTMAMTAPGAIRLAARWPPVCGRTGFFGVAMSEHQLLDANQVGEDLGHCFEQRARNHVADFGLGIERAGQGHVLDDRHAVLARHV